MKRQYYSETNERLLTYEEVCAVTQLFPSHTATLCPVGALSCSHKAQPRWPSRQVPDPGC